MTVPSGDQVVAKERAGGLRLIRRVVIVLSIVVAVNVALGAVSFVRIGTVASDSNNALCALRGDLERRVASSEQFLRENPNGIPGISAKVIRDGMTNQRRTIAALSRLDCS